MRKLKAWIVAGWWRLREWVHGHSVGIVLTTLIILAILVYFAPDMIISVGPGHSGVLWRRFAGGTVTVAPDGRPYIGRIGADQSGQPTGVTENIRFHDEELLRRGYHVWPYGEGIHFIFPWDKLYIYDIRLQQVSHSYAVLTNDGLEVQAQVTIRWKPIEADLGKLHRDLGPNYVNTLIIPLVGAYVREEIARYSPDALYSAVRLEIQDQVLKKTEDALRSHFYPDDKRESYVMVEDILIRDVELPAEVRQAIEEKVVQKHIAESYRYRLDRERQEAERKAIEAQGIQRFQAIINSTISEGYLKWKGIDATMELAKSPNAKIVVIGTGKDGLPIILGGLEGAATVAGAMPTTTTAPTTAAAPTTPPSTTAAAPP
jgi:regulator of protease activity HflC (stomatin/prohibitin superfamily)